jgi:CRISPR-associated protein (TIGR02584 family)
VSALPWQFRERVLLAVTGLSPQVVTETLYSLAVQQNPPFVPTRVMLLTTAEGAERARLTLLSREPGWFRQLQAEWRLPGVQFDDSCIRVLRSGGGQPLADIRTEADNLAAADQVAETIRSLTRAADTALHVSVAGGRKTLGFFAGYALSLFGREQDRLSHVLVSAPFESHPGFFYPTRGSRIIYTPPPDSRPLDTSQAEVTLAEIPFVRLRRLLPARLCEQGSSFAAAVEAARGALEAPRLVIDLSRHRLRAGAVEFSLPPAELAFLAWFARRRREGREPLPCPNEGAPELDYSREYLREYQALGAKMTESRTNRALRRGMEKAFFLEKKSRLQAALRQRLGPLARPYEVQAFGRRPETRYGLGLEPEQIVFEEARRA